MDKYLETFETWNKVAKLYEEKFMYLDLYNDTYDKFCEIMVKKNATILEVGCGPGNITKYLLDKRPDFEILATDISPNMIELAKINCPNATFQIIDSREIENIKKKFDAIVCGFCLPYLSELDVEKFIIDCKNLLNENGILYLSFVEGEKDKSGYIKGSSGDQTYFYYHNLENLISQLNLNNFEKQDVIRKSYEKNDKAEEIHTIILTENNRTNHNS
ncbi:ubiquinone/menaquinone biosynthesis C-methylase UbiE [Chryseobacterium ginsenosidimutans]|uniref:class I SAM-dependent methyltransferase n=1 Tax=Chryseobacterium ginsenosidimutans TaxID=687846 RepID=UPI00278782F8|nr:class I SAM-dependent methyltransferase [Chryseobacterium ginsenosidimutans]MDQ0593503.1 ubiquinone/menaquinone biosynthesis C-methylase UbiE [Chryseobacterium ginsenosidimutans]